MARLQDRARRPTSAARGRSENPGFSQRGDAVIVVTQRFPQYFLGMLAQQRRRNGIHDRCQAHAERRLNIRNGTRGRVRNLAEAVTVAHLRGVESLLDRAKIAAGHVGFLHLSHPVLEPIAREHFADDRAKRFFIGRTFLSVCEPGIDDEIRPLQYLDDQSAIQPVVCAGDIKRSDLFITSKLWCSFHKFERVRQQCLITINDLQCQYLDLFLIHWPFAFVDEVISIDYYFQ